MKTDHDGTGSRYDNTNTQTIFMIGNDLSTAKGKIDGPLSITDLALTAPTRLGLEIDPECDLNGSVAGLKGQ